MLPPAALLPPLQSSSVQILEHFKLSVMQILGKSVCYIKQHKVCLRKPTFWFLNSAVPGDCCGRFCLPFAIPGQLGCLNVVGADALQSLQSSVKKKQLKAKKNQKHPSQTNQNQKKPQTAKGSSLLLLRAAVMDCTGWTCS